MTDEEIKNSPGVTEEMVEKIRDIVGSDDIIVSVLYRSPSSTKLSVAIQCSSALASKTADALMETVRQNVGWPTAAMISICSLFGRTCIIGKNSGTRLPS